MKLYPPKSIFLEDHILPPKGCCTSKFLHMLETEQVLLAHPPLRTGSPYNFFQMGGSKIGLIFTF